MFAILLIACFPSSPTELWGKYNSHMSEDISRRIRKENSNMSMDFTAEIYNEALIENLCLEITNKILYQSGMPSHNLSAAASFDEEVRRETNYKHGCSFVVCAIKY